LSVVPISVFAHRSGAVVHRAGWTGPERRLGVRARAASADDDQDQAEEDAAGRNDEVTSRLGRGRAVNGPLLAGEAFHRCRMRPVPSG
jgi:hypothetical protein